MQFSRDWLAEYVDLPSQLEELTTRLTFAGLSVEYAAPSGDDVLLEIEVTPNRPDCMNHVGLAREIAVLFDTELRAPRVEWNERATEVESVANVVVEEPSLCPRYSLAVIDGVSPSLSPDWLQLRLEAVGVRPINNVVDVTNFVLWELGQPLHAFDLDKLRGPIVVRRARKGEPLHTLDGAERELSDRDLVIADGEQSIALAGVMGGLDTEVGPECTRVLLESAHFDRTSVRKSSKRYGLHTDASHRFERGTDPGVCVDALGRAAALIAEIAGGRVLEGALDVLDSSCLERTEIAFEPARLDAFSGTPIDRRHVKRWFGGLGIEIEEETPEVWRARVPSWRRFDLQLPADLYEEAMRIFGFDNIPAALPLSLGSDGPETAEQRRRRRVQDHLVGQGFAEAIQLVFITPEEDQTFPVLRPEIAAAELQNPLSERYAVLRRSMAPGLVQSARSNQRRGVGAVRQFEIGHVFLEHEEEHLGVVIGGRAGSPWDGGRATDFFDLKGVFEGLFEVFSMRLEASAAELPGILSGTGAELRTSSGEWVGYFGRVLGEDPFPLFVGELSCAVLDGALGVATVEVPSRFPGVSADLTLTHAISVPFVELAETVDAAAPPDLVKFHLKDRYLGQGVPEGAVNTTISFHYNAPDRSLSQEEINHRQTKLAELLESRHGWPG